MKRNHTLTLASALAVMAGAATSFGQVVLPADYAMPAGSVNTSRLGVRARPYMTAATHGGTLAWSSGQLDGLYGANTADLTGADASGYFTIDGVVNWNIAAGSTVDTFPGADAMPGITGDSTVNFTEEVISYLEFPSAGTYTLGVNSDDGFGLWACYLNPKSRFGSISVGAYDGTRGSGDTLFNVSVSKAGIYPFRLVYFNVGGGGNVSWFNVVTNSSSTNYVLINDPSDTTALKAYATSSLASPFIGGFSYNPAGFAFNIYDDATALLASSLKVTLNGAPVDVTVTKSGTTNVVAYAAPTLLPGKQTNTVTISYSDTATPANSFSGTNVFVMPEYTEVPASMALASSDVDTTQRGFLYRVSQIDSGTYGVIAANTAHAEAQLAGVLTDPVSGAVYPNIAAAGTQANGSYLISSVINLTQDTTTEKGAFTSTGGYADTALPGINSGNSDNIAGEIVAYLDLQPGFYNFAVNASDGFRATFAANPYDALGTMAGIFDHRASALETQFGLAVTKAGLYPLRLVWYCVTGNASLELYTISTDGTRILVNDATKPAAVKAYWKRTASYGTYVKYAGPSAFVSPFNDSADVGFKTVNVIISDGSATQVDAATAALTIDGTAVATTKQTANGLTTLSYTPTGTQLPRTQHAARLTYNEAVTGTAHTASWNFHLLRNYVLPTALYFEDFESTVAGPEPTVPAGWVQENFTGSQTAGNDTTDLSSDFYLGWVVVDRSWDISKDFKVSAYASQVLNGVTFSDDAAPLLVNHYLRAETDSRQNGPPGQIQYITTKAYDLTGKTGTVIAFNSSYEQNQDNINGLEYSVDGGTTWNPVFYWLQGDSLKSDPSDVIRNGVGTVDVVKTMTTSYSDVARYTDPTTQELVGGYYGFFIKAPITQALAPYIEGRINDNDTESKRIEVYHVPLADNQKSVKFRFIQAGTSSWYWAIDNWGIYSVPSLAVTVTEKPTLNVSRAGQTLTFTWSSTAAFQLQKRSDVASGAWSNVGSAAANGSVTDAATGTQAFYRLISQ